VPPRLTEPTKCAYLGRIDCLCGKDSFRRLYLRCTCLLYTYWNIEIYKLRRGAV